MTSWDDRYRAGEYPTNTEPSTVLQRYLPQLPSGPAIDIATGSGRNAVLLAQHATRVDAIDQSRIGLELARDRLPDEAAPVNWIQADAREFDYPCEEYDVVTISYFRVLDRLPDIKDALTPGGYLFYEHHLRTPERPDLGPPSKRYRFASNEMLRATLDFTVVYYEEGTRTVDDRTAATARVIARKSSGPAQRYPASIHAE